MKTGIHSEHWDDAAGNPCGGNTFGNGFAIGWQHGPLGRGAERKEPNGAFVEDVIRAAIDRLEYYQRGKFASHYNEGALGHLREACAILESRTADREARRVEGTHAD